MVTHEADIAAYARRVIALRRRPHRVRRAERRRPPDARANTLMLALRAIRRNVLRSFLTMLGIVIGVGAVIAMVTIGNGTTRQGDSRPAPSSAATC